MLGLVATNRRIVATMAFAVGGVVANNYYAQPLEDAVARAFHASTTSVGFIVTVIQLGYAVGLITLLPLGDLLERRRLLVSMLGVTVVALLTIACAPSLGILASAAAILGVSTVAGQVIIPFAAHIAEEGEQGKVISTVMSGLLIGILLSRTIAGLVAQVAGWRSVYVLGAVLTASVAVLLWRELPVLAPTTKMRYPALLGSVVRLIREEPLLRLRMSYGFCTYASFGTFWASYGFLLARPPYNWSQAAIGLFALLGVAGATTARFAGKLADKGFASYATGGFVLAVLASYILLAIGGHSAVALAIGVAVFDLGVQGTHISNQSLFYPLRPDARSRLNTAYMTAYFLGGALGSGLSATIYASNGWPGVCVLGAVFPAAALLLWLTEMLVKWRRGSRTRRVELQPAVQ